MPARSKNQQQAMAIELERRRRGQEPQRFKNMSRKELKDFASTDRKRLPTKK